MEIATGHPEDHPGSGATPLPLDASMSPGVQAPTAIQPGQLDGPTWPGRDVRGEYREQMAAPLAECEAAMGAGMAAETDRRARYAAGILPTGAAYGDTMTLAGGSLDPGAGTGETQPAGYFYDPPRLGAPETYTGNEPGGG